MTESYVLIGVLLVIDLLLVLLLPDTKGIILPDSIADVKIKAPEDCGKLEQEMKSFSHTHSNTAEHSINNKNGASPEKYVYANGSLNIEDEDNSKDSAENDYEYDEDGFTTIKL